MAEQETQLDNLVRPTLLRLEGNVVAVLSEEGKFFIDGRKTMQAQNIVDIAEYLLGKVVTPERDGNDVVINAEIITGSVEFHNEMTYNATADAYRDGEISATLRQHHSDTDDRPWLATTLRIDGFYVHTSKIDLFWNQGTVIGAPMEHALELGTPTMLKFATSGLMDEAAARTFFEVAYENAMKLTE